MRRIEIVERDSISAMHVVERTLQVLDALSGQSDSVSGVQLGQQLGLPASTLHRLLAVLVKHGFAVQEADSRRYRLGPAVLSLSQAYLRRNPLTSVALPHLAQLRSRVQETVFLTALVGDDAMCIATAESPRPLQFFMHPGRRMPYHAAAAARAILAYRSDEEALRLLCGEVLERFTPSTPTTVEQVLSELQAVRQEGVAVCAEEMEIGVTAISAPVRDAAGVSIASVTVVAPSGRLWGAERRGAAEAVQDTAQAISEALGYRPRPPAVGATLERSLPEGRSPASVAGYGATSPSTREAAP